MEKKRVGVLALLMMLATVGAFVGAGSASATTPPNDSMCRTNGTGDATVDLPGVFYATLDNDNIGNINGQGFWACAVPPDVGVGVGLRDPNSANPYGTGFEAAACLSPAGMACGYLVNTTGAEVGIPATTTTSGATPGGSAGTATGTCVYVNGSIPHPDLCPRGLTVAGVTIATADASVDTHPNTGGCVTAGSSPCAGTVPSGVGISVAKGDPSNRTVETTVLGSPVGADVGGCYGYNAPSTC